MRQSVKNVGMMPYLSCFSHIDDKLTVEKGVTQQGFLGSFRVAIDQGPSREHKTLHSAVIIVPVDLQTLHDALRQQMRFVRVTSALTKGWKTNQKDTLLIRVCVEGQEDQHSHTI